MTTPYTASNLAPTKCLILKPCSGGKPSIESSGSFLMTTSAWTGTPLQYGYLQRFLPDSPHTQWSAQVNSSLPKQDQWAKDSCHSHQAYNGLDWFASWLLIHHRNHQRFCIWAPQMLSKHPSSLFAQTCILHACCYQTFFSQRLSHSWVRPSMTTFSLCWHLCGQFFRLAQSWINCMQVSLHDLSSNQLSLLT